MHHYDVLLGIGCCPSCGYCAPALAELPAEAAETVRGEAYRRASEVAGPELARAWHCWSLLCGDYKLAALSNLKAAWACDDEEDEEASRFFRTEALKSYAADLRENTPTDDQREQVAILILDLERRTGRLEEAAAE